MDTEMHNHVERTRAEASHAYEPQYEVASMQAAMELVEFLTKTFGQGVGGMAVSTGMAEPHELKPIPMLSSEQTIVKRGRGRPRKLA